MAEKNSRTLAGAQLISFDTDTNQKEVSKILRRLVKEDADSRKTRIIYVILGTQGVDDGSVKPEKRDIDFKSKDLASARIIRNNINIRDYHQTASNRWEELNNKGENCILILAWSYSHQWTTNTSANGNNGKIQLEKYAIA